MFPRWPWILCGNTRALGDACGSSGKPRAAREPHLGCFHCTYGFGRSSWRTASRFLQSVALMVVESTLHPIAPRVPGMQGRHSKCLSAKITAPTSHEHFLVRVGSSGGVDHKVPFIMVCSAGGVAYQFPLMSAGPCSHALLCGTYNNNSSKNNSEYNKAPTTPTTRTTTTTTTTTTE